jgi:hypothetical protein
MDPSELYSRNSVLMCISGACSGCVGRVSCAEPAGGNVAAIGGGC